MKDITTLGIDLAKDVFQLYGTDGRGKKVTSKRLSRAKLAEHVMKLKPCLIGLEACGGSHYWARKFREMGHAVKLMHPRFVKPYVKSNKNDYADAEAIAEAVTRPNMRFVGIKEISDQDMQSLHRARERLVKNKTQAMNHIRGILHEYGIVCPKGYANLKKKLVEVLSNNKKDLSSMMLDIVNDAYDEIIELNKRIKKYASKIESMANKDERGKRLQTIPGIGPISATAILSSVGDPNNFTRGRQMSASFGLVPKHVASGHKIYLQGISKRGDRYVRKLLIHGARAVVKNVEKKDDARSKWVKRVIERCGKNKAVVALANKNARIAWALLVNETSYDANFIKDKVSTNV